LIREVYGKRGKRGTSTDLSHQDGAVTSSQKRREKEDEGKGDFGRDMSKVYTHSYDKDGKEIGQGDESSVMKTLKKT